MRKLWILGMMMGILKLNAQDRLFTYTYQSNVLNKGQKEIEVWSTMRNSREHFFRGFDHRMEFETGLGNRLQTAFYLNYGYFKGIESNNGVESLFFGSSYSFSNEWKFKVSDPVVNAIGSALYFEYTLGTDETELEGKLILDKQIGKSVHSLNIVGEYEMEKEFEVEGNEIEAETEKEFKLGFNYGFAYKLNTNFALSMELLNKNLFEEGELEYSVISAGPGLSYNHEGFWVNLTCMPQIMNLKTGKQDLVDNEKLQTRLIFSYVF